MNDRISPEWKNTNTTSFDDAARIAEVESWLASQFDASAGRDVPAFEYTPRSITRLHALATASKANTRAASIIASDLRLKASDYRSQAVRIREILENLELALERLSPGGVGSAQVIANVANFLNLKDTEMSSKYFPEHKLPDNVIATTDAKMALLGADFCLHAVPVQFSSSFLEGISEHVDPNLPFISLSKGLELNTLRTMSQIIPKALGNPSQPFVTLSGPSFALELMRKLPTAMVVASKDKKLASAAQQLIASNNLRINSSRWETSPVALTMIPSMSSLLRILLNYIFHCNWYAWVDGFLNFSMRYKVRKKSSKKRVPVTEKSGRVHTSAVSVAILPQADQLSTRYWSSSASNRSQFSQRSASWLAMSAQKRADCTGALSDMGTMMSKEMIWSLR